MLLYLLADLPMYMFAYMLEYMLLGEVECITFAVNPLLLQPLLAPRSHEITFRPGGKPITFATPIGATPLN